eukprot:scaffold2393_cov267-Pinguiococcus_pyrenoidosus.AAC.21
MGLTPTFNDLLIQAVCVALFGRVRRCEVLRVLQNPASRFRRSSALTIEVSLNRPLAGARSRDLGCLRGLHQRLGMRARLSPFPLVEKSRCARGHVAVHHVALASPWTESEHEMRANRAVRSGLDVRIRATLSCASSGAHEGSAERQLPVVQGVVEVAAELRPLSA